MLIQFLGTGDAFCNGGRYQTCFLVEVSDFRFLMDCGATSLLALKSSSIDSNLINGIIISHFHGDHFGGLPYVLLDANFGRQRTDPLYIAGPTGIAEKVGELMDICYPKVEIGELSFEVRFQEFEGNQKFIWGPLAVETFPVVHVAEAHPHGLRIIHNDTVLAFSGDTGWTENLYKISDLADLFICECNFYQTEIASHLNYQRIMDERNNFNCQRIVLNHLGPEMLNNLDSVSLECINDGMILEI